jgi:hypothetical protein
MLFENSNCKIYQNYNRNFIFNEIELLSNDNNTKNYKIEYFKIF